MPSPFPGMDPYLENQEWEDFHTSAITVIRDQLSPLIRPDYIARVERRVYLETEPGDEEIYRIADVAVVAEQPAASRETARRSSVATIEPVKCMVHTPGERREAYLEIRDRATKEVITVIELLSPTNKRRGGDGRREYLAKRKEVLKSRSHLVEIDLLRGGLRLPLETPRPAGDYYVYVSRSYTRPQLDVYAWNLDHPLPPVPVPLREGDEDVFIDLQAVLDTVYERAGYDLSINYQEALSPSPTAAQSRWIRQVLSEC